MTTIADIRKQYPQYSDISDAQLADAFYTKFYSDMPKQEFYKSINFSPELQRGRPTMANDPRILTGREPAPSNETMLERAGRFLSTPAPLVTPEQLGGSTVGRIAQGVLDPLLGVGQLAAQALGNETVSQRLREQEARYQRARETSGDTGFDLARIGGNILNPINYLVPAAATGGLLRSAATGATLAATQPVYGKDFWEDKGVQAAVGSILGPLAEYGVKGAGKLLDSFKGLSETGRLQAVKDLLDKASGKDKEVIVRALQEAQPIVPGSRPTAMEALAETPAGAPIAALQKTIQRQPEVAAASLTRRAEQEAARQAQLRSIAGTPEQRAALATERAAVTTPMRETALEQANVFGQTVPRLESEIAAREQAAIANLQGAGRSATEQAQAAVRSETAPMGAPVLTASGRPMGGLTGGQVYQAAGMPMRFPERYTGNYDLAKQYVGAIEDFTSAAAQRKAEAGLKRLQLQSVTDEGFYPLATQPLISKIDASLNRVGERSNELLTSSLQSLRSKLERFTDENGIINSVDLYNIRKEIGDDIRGFLTQKQGTNASFGAQAVNVEKTLKNYLDDAVNKASGTTLWSDYLKKYADYSQRINRMDVGAELEKKLGTTLGNKERAAVFAQAVDDAAGTIKRATGVSRFERLSDVLTKDETAAVNRVLADLSRLEKGKALAGSVNVPEYAPKAPLEGTAFLSRAYTIAKEVMQALSRGSREDFERKFLELSMEPQAMAALMQAGPITGQRKLVEAINKRLSPEAQQIFIQSFGTTAPAREAGQ